MFEMESQQQPEIEKNREPYGSLFALFADFAVGAVDSEITCPFTPTVSLVDCIPLLFSATEVNFF